MPGSRPHQAGRARVPAEPSTPDSQAEELYPLSGQYERYLRIVEVARSAEVAVEPSRPREIFLPLTLEIRTGR